MAGYVEIFTIIRMIWIGGGMIMPAEKLLLNLLIVIAPVLLYSAFLDKGKWKSPIICGILHSTAALFSMTFSYHNYGFNWDFRYVPLALAFLYGGPAAGGMVIASIVLTRLVLGGETVLLEIANAIAIALVLFLMKKKFWSLSPNKRVLLLTLISIFTLLVFYSSHSVLYYFKTNNFKLTLHLSDLVLVGLIHTIASALAAKLYEGLIERDKLQQEIIRTEKLNTIGEMAASIAHEVRNPLTVVKGFLQLMKQEKNYEYLSLVLSELGRAESIINDYLNFARPKFEKIEIFRLHDVLSEVILLMEPLAIKQGVELENRLEISDFSLVTDRNQLKQALVNLIKNGIEATPDGGKVMIYSKINEACAIITIRDTGKGMTREQLSRIGTLFYTTKDKGTGLGTSVSMKIIETMNGKITFHSEPGEGTKVTLLLPGGNVDQI